MAGRGLKKKNLSSTNIKWYAGIYARRSFDEMEEIESDTILHQRELIENYINSKKDIEIIDTYIDDGYSGTTFNRPAFKELFNDIKNGKINTIIVKDLSRLGRNYIELGKYLEEIFPIYNIRIIAINDLIDSWEDPTSITSLIVPIKNLMNDEYAKDISKKVKSAYLTMAKMGKYVAGTSPYGYKIDENDKHHLVIDEEEAPIVIKIFNMAKDGMGRIKICKYLNDNNILCRKEKQRRIKRNIDIDNFTIKCRYRWGTTTIGRLLTNEVYIGNLVQNKTGNISYKNHRLVPKPKEEWIKVENTHEGIIENNLFYIVQNSIKKNTNTHSLPKTYSKYNGILKCGDCLKAMQKQDDFRGNRNVSNYYCSNYLRSSNSCTHHKIKAEELDRIVLEAIHQQIRLVIEIEKEIHKSYTMNDFENLKYELKYNVSHLQKKISNEKDNKRKLYENWKLERITYEDYLNKKNEIDATINKYERQIEENNNNYKKKTLILKKNEYWISHYKRNKKIKKITREILREIIESIYIYENNKIEIVFKYKDEYERVIDMLKREEEYKCGK